MDAYDRFIDALADPWRRFRQSWQLDRRELLIAVGLWTLFYVFVTVASRALDWLFGG